MLQSLSTDLYLASLPHLARYFDATPAAAQQTLSIFVIGFGAAQLITGPASDRYGRRPIVLAGLTLYVAAAIACAASVSLDMLLAARLAQAIGCCTAVVIARAVVRDAQDPAQGARTLARASLIMGLAPLFGPVLGSWLQVTFGWRAAFAAHACIGSLLALAVWLGLEETNRKRDPDALRPAGLAAGYREILREPVFWAYALPGALSYAGIFVFISGESFVLIDVLKLPTAMFGYAFAAGVSGFIVGSETCRRLFARIGVSRTGAFGAWVSLAGGLTFLLAAAAGMRHWSGVVGGAFCAMFAHGIQWPTAQAGAVAPFAHRAGGAAGLLGFLAMLAALGVGTAIGATYDGTLYPMAIMSALVGAALFASVRGMRRFRVL